MRVWIVLLRAVGAALLLFDFAWGASQYVIHSGAVFAELYNFIFPVLVLAALGTLCLGAAAALNSLARMEARITRATTARRQAAQESSAPKDLSPDAPNWPERKFAVRPARWEQRARRMERMDAEDSFDKAMLTRRVTKRQDRS